MSRNSREHHYSQNTFSHTDVYSEWDSSSERGQSDTCSVMGLSDTYSEIQFDYSRSYSPIVTYSGSKCVLNSNTYRTRSLTKKMLEKKDCKIHEDCNSSFSLGEEVRGRQSRSSSRGIRHRRRRRRRSRSLGLSRNTRKRRSNRNTFSPTEPSYSECDSNSEIGLSDTCSVVGRSDIYSDIGVEDSQAESQFNSDFPVRSYSIMTRTRSRCGHVPVRSYSVMTRSRSRCVLNSTKHMTRSLTKKMQEGSFPFCRCETCRETKEMIGKENWRVHKNSEVNLNRSVPGGEVGSSRRRCRSFDSYVGKQYRRRRSRRHSWGRSTIMHHSIQNTDRSLAFMKRFRTSMQVSDEAGMKQEYVAEGIDCLNNGMYELNVIG